jgi:protocatechuate 3,4-dioxygenase beta subunit
MTEAPLPHPSVFLGQQRLKVIRGYRVHEQRTPSQDIHVITPSQTIGPFFGVGLVRPGDEDLACKQPRGARAEGTPIIIQGQVMDENGKPVRKALIEVWQANRWGKYEHPDDTTQRRWTRTSRGGVAR